jgi:hypothetical protein
MSYWKLAKRRLHEMGPGYVGRKVIHALTDSLYSRIEYRRHRAHYPLELIFIAGLAKSGSTWLSAMLGQLPGFRVVTPMRMKLAPVTSWDSFENSNLYPEMFKELSGRLAVVKEHTWPFEENLRLLHEQNIPYLVTMRDPRDALISSYYDARRNHWHWDHTKAASLSLSDYMTDKLESGMWNQICLDWMRGWLEASAP